MPGGRLARTCLAAVVCVLLAVAGCASSDGVAGAAPLEAAAPDGTRFGLSETERQKVYIQLVGAEARAARRGAGRALRDRGTWGPTQSTASPGPLQERMAVAERWGLSLDQLQAVEDEGYAKDWPTTRRR